MTVKLDSAKPQVLRVDKYWYCVVLGAARTFATWKTAFDHALLVAKSGRGYV
jgi:hypothetical protein